MRKAERSRVASRASEATSRGQPAFGDRASDLGEDAIDVDARPVGQRLGEAGDRQAVLSTKPLDQRRVGRGLLGGVERESELLASACDSDVDGHEDQRRLGEDIWLVWPAQQPKAQEQRVHAPLVARGLGVVRHRPDLFEERRRAEAVGLPPDRPIRWT